VIEKFISIVTKAVTLWITVRHFQRYLLDTTTFFMRLFAMSRTNGLSVISALARVNVDPG